MIEIGGYCLLQGDRFSPAKVETELGVHFEKKNEPGEVGQSGRFRGQPIPYGSAELVFDAQNGDGASFRVDPRVLHLLQGNKRVLEDAGVTDIVVHFDIAFRGQCNLEMSPEFLRKVAELNIPVSLSCYPS